MTTHAEPRVSHRFRRRLLGVMLIAGLLPAALVTVFSDQVVERVSTLSLADLDKTLERVGEDLDRRGADPALRGELREAELYLAQAQAARRPAFASLRFLFVASLGGSAAVLALSAYLLGRAVSRPLEQITAGMLRFGRGDLAFRLPERATGRPDELELLVRQFNRMGDDLAAQRARLAETEKLAAWQDVARQMAHDLRNPLTAMKMATGRIARPDAAAEAVRESLDLLGGEIDRLIKMTQSFSTFAKLPQPVMARVEILPLLADVCALYSEQAPGRVEWTGGPAAAVDADADQLRRLFGNLVKNAIEASAPGDGPVRVELQVAGAHARVVVSDGGTGIGKPIAGADLTRGLATTKAGGSGLGLPISHKIVHDHGGTLRLEPRPDRGTRAIVEIPILT